MWAVVDLGAKTAGALDHFRRRYGTMHFQNGVDISPRACLAVDRDERHRSEAEQKGYGFMCSDILAKEFQWPQADFYLAVNLLEYLPSPQHARSVLRAMIEHAKKGVWVRISSHERDETGLGQLRRHGLRFFWSRWVSHRARVTLDQIRSAVLSYSDRAVLREMPRTVIGDSSSNRIVPETAPWDCQSYTESLGEKTQVRFDPPLVAEWDVFVVKTPVAEP